MKEENKLDLWENCNNVHTPSKIRSNQQHLSKNHCHLIGVKGFSSCVDLAGRLTFILGQEISLRSKTGSRHNTLSQVREREENISL